MQQHSEISNDSIDTGVDSNEVEVCPVCDSQQVDVSIDKFEGICTECGFVIHNGTESSAPDWQVVRREKEKQSRKKDWRNSCRVQNATEEQLAQAFEDLEDIADRLSLPVDIRRNAADIYCEAFLAGTTDGRDTTAVVGACIRLSSLEMERPVPTSRLSESPDIDTGQFRRSCTILREALDRTPPAPMPADYLEFLIDQLTVDETHLRESIQMLEGIVDTQSLIGKDPGGIAAAALYLSKEELTQSDVAEAIGVSTETVRNRVAQLRRFASDG